MKRTKKFGKPKVEECDTWLDTRELRRRKVESHFISKLLYPLSRRNYTVEVPLNFTQTRAPQQCVKQTTVSSFFLPKAKGKLAHTSQTSVLSAVGAASPNSVIEKGTYTDQPELITGNCRDNFGSSTPVDHQERLPSILSTVHYSFERLPLCGTTHGNSTLILNEQSHQILEERQHSCLKDGANINIVKSELPSAHDAGVTYASVDTSSEPPDDFTQLDFTQDLQGNRVISHTKAIRSPGVNYVSCKGMPVADGKSTDLPPAESEILCTQSFEAGLLGMLTSTQQTVDRQKKLSKRKAVAHLPKKLNSDCYKDIFPENKENVFGSMLNLNPKSLKRPPLSPGTTSLLRCQNVPQGTEAFQQPKTACRDENVLSFLFSQDSQGNRVISHRCTDSRCGAVFSDNQNSPLGPCSIDISGNTSCNVPLKRKLHHSGLCCESPCMAQSKYDDMFCPQADLLFTQDSEGNAVIKH
ncbi:uncharacterized protein LOC109925694 [Rhincodon typus]|uniref:uncharacterized protein LOC109925694 n=1 Tax=Rhincodon typus TaxID=259920 RepID=UPI0009A36CEA|nr:uncharacterized protein LOC109925694 [Rhincodon typus]